MSSYLKSIGNYLVHEMLPHACDALLSSPYLNTVKFGSTCVIIGAGTLLHSRIPQIVKEKLFAPDPEKSAPPLTKGRIAQAIFGSALVIYGLYNFYLGCTTLFQHETRSPEETLKQVVSKIKECPQTLELWKHASKKPKFSVQLESSSVRTGGEWYAHNNTIVLDSGLTESRMQKILVFELCNANRKIPPASLFASDTSMMEFVKKRIEGEWSTINCHHQTVEKCVRSHHWDQELDDYRTQLESTPTFEDFWKDYQQAPRYATHRKHQKDLWAKIFKSAFCKKNPTSPECRTQ